ncbi:hypothetical protein [Hydrogenophaga sp.]|uniref:hypothetical protein n=1 Tax=Hydrogenophaga sp. TaxID=1904254 RepID=UPI003F6AAB73
MARSSAPYLAQALARWTVLLIGWVWLGLQGQRLGWSVASGVLAVALWWALRLVFAQSRFIRHLPPHAPVLLGAITAGGALGVAGLAASTTAHALLLALACVWALWSAALGASSGHARCPGHWAGWPPLLGAGLTGLAMGAPGLLATLGLQPAPGTAAACVLLFVAALQLGVSSAHSVDHPAPQTAAALLPQTAMGLMMGTLWLASAWCATAALPASTVVALHVLLMAALPGLARLRALPRQRPPAAAQTLPLSLVLLGTVVLLWGNGPAHGFTGMGLLALAWALRGGRFTATTPTHPPSCSASALARHCAPLGGPALLLAVGWFSPTLGPQALQAAYGLLGACALVALLHQAVRAWRAGHTPLFSTPSTQRDPA